MRKVRKARKLSPRLRLRRVLESVNTREGRIFAFTIQGLIFISLLGFAIDTLPNLPRWARKALYGLELFTVGIFTIEYILRIWVARRPLRYIFSFYGLIDLLAILPFWLGLADMRALRILRFIRLLRLLKVLRYVRALDRLERALRIVREELIVFLGLAMLLIFLAAAGIWHFEHEAQPEKFASVFHALWWAVVTLTTVGYGDAFPVTLGGRIFTTIILILGIGLVTVPSGLIASAFQEERRRERQEAKERARARRKKKRSPGARIARRSGTLTRVAVKRPGRG